MAFNPALPQTNTPMASAEMRDQLNALKDLIAALPTSAAMTDAIVAQSAGNADIVPLSGLPVSNPPTQAEVTAIAAKLISLIEALQRT